ncbi:MAG: DNA mismatch repair protein MutS [Betaproteobacteria bacterium]|nr:MAG: DNA mismatch repair protein MutS [Betaproteobacteria bacterium]
MKAFLLHGERDFDPQQPLPPQATALTQDLELETLFQAMAAGDEFLLDVARKVVLSVMKNDIDTILYRQEIVKDCLQNPGAVRQLYDLALEAVTREKKGYWGFLSKYPGSILHDAIQGLEIFTEVLRKLRGVAEEQSGRFQSRGFTALFAMLRKELSDEYLAAVQEHLTELRFKHGVLLSAELGKGSATCNFLLRKPHGETRGWLARLLSRAPARYTFRLHPRDEAGGRILTEMRDRGINHVASALGQSRDHVLSFFVTLRTELAFYAGCLNLHERLAAMEEPSCFPRPAPAGQRRHSFSELYDVCLALTMGRKAVGNSADAEDKSLVIITGANQGGKSTFLRSAGLAQLMMQCGMFVPARSFDAELCTDLFTHYKREEDATMKSGKLDEELARMSDIADLIRPDSLVLFNESFAATNEREGSEIARQVVSALLEKRVKVFFVTHQYEFARGFFETETNAALFLRAERKADGTRTFRVREGEPLQTSFGEDLYREIFGSAPEAETAAPAHTAAKRASR